MIERTINRTGNRLLVPDVTVGGWWASLGDSTCSAEKIIDFYCTSDVLMACVVLTYNILRWIRLVSLLRDDAPIRHEAKRRLPRTVIQELMYVTVRVVESGRRLALKFSTPVRHCRASKPSKPASLPPDITSFGRPTARLTKPRKVQSLRNSPPLNIPRTRSNARCQIRHPLGKLTNPGMNDDGWFCDHAPDQK